MIERLDMENEYNATEAAIHMNRYEIAKQYCKNKKVLDISCGEGYGSYLLSKWGAREVVGIDISKDAINKASRNFKNDNLKYLVQDATNLEKLDDNYFDLVVSFETFEHIEKCDLYLKEIKRVSKNGAIIVISCPNDYYYYPDKNQHNPYHIKKYKFDEFKSVTEKVFGNNVMYMAGMELMGYVNTFLDNDKSLKNKDMISIEKDIDCVKIISSENHDFSNCNYYIGVWNSKNVEENCVVYPHMYTDWKTAIDIYRNDIDIYKNNIDILKNEINTLEKQQEEYKKQQEEYKKQQEEYKKQQEEYEKRVNKLIIENDKLKTANRVLYVENEEARKFSENYFSMKEEFNCILNSGSYKLARKISKLLKLVKRK